MVLKRSWPAVSHICSFTRLPSSSMVRILKSMPIVVMNEGVKESSLNRSRQHDLPTPESPIKRSLICVEISRRRTRAEAYRQTYEEIVVSCSRHVEVCGVGGCGGCVIEG
jgi:hypothetical protein